ncbi:hypothetical protein LIPSTDRAFT_71670 [Lipomyces starkeyi NRRL Y-11557]|uniref:Retrotransposon gag domain-containing protein n=1 Tax=Lipomyces starkeyi NRRL Y-11557 TaxID=675824 RepID=A0A1E3Q6I3_LIPST|nr:hypothetical protein LIPSTDRAFT_71670 [Lipomyces starkeyi NRRL Y-11557]
MQLNSELATLKYADCKDANEFVQKFTGLVSRHASTGKPVDEEEQVRLFMDAVGSCFEVWKRLKRAEVRRGLIIEDLTTVFSRRGTE